MWSYNGQEIYESFEGVEISMNAGIKRIVLTCIQERHYATVQCIAVLGTSNGTKIGSSVATIRVQGIT